MRRGAAEPEGADRGELLEAAVLAPLQAGYDDLTKAEKKLASYVLARPNCVVLETASTIARNVGVSQMTVSRFLRKLGFEGLSGIRHRLKADLYGPDGASLWSIDRRYEAFTRRRAARFGLEESLAAELAAIRRTYELAATKLWGRVVDSVAVGRPGLHQRAAHGARAVAGAAEPARIHQAGRASGRRPERPLCRRAGRARRSASACC